MEKSRSTKEVLIKIVLWMCLGAIQVLVITYNLPASPYINKTICPPKVVLHTLMEQSTRNGGGQISLLKYGSRAVHTIYPKQNLPAVSMMVWRANCVFDAGI